MAETIFFIFVVNFPTSWLSVSADIVVKACYSFWCSTDGVVFSDRYYFWEYNHASSDTGCWTTRKTWPPGFLCKEVRWSVLLSHLEHLKVSKWVFALSSVDRETAFFFFFLHKENSLELNIALVLCRGGFLHLFFESELFLNSLLSRQRK